MRIKAADMSQDAPALMVERDRLAAELRQCRDELASTKEALRIREVAEISSRPVVIDQATLLADVDAGGQATLAEELRVSLQELQTFAGELGAANASLLRAKDELERRVASRTAELQDANARLSESEALLRLAQHHAGAGAWNLDVASGKLVWSCTNFDLHGIVQGADDLTYAQWLATIVENDRIAADEAMQRALQDCDPDYRIDYRVHVSGRGERWISARGRVICDANGQAVRVLGLNLDITDRKRAELDLARINATLREEVERQVRERESAQARLFQNLKLEALGQLTGGVAHDFNNLLSVIISSAALLRQAEAPADRERLLNGLEQAAHRGAALTQRLLTFARRQSLTPETIDTSAWLRDMRELLTRSLRADITIDIDAPPGIWPALADTGELELAVLNLAVNARDAMPKGGTLRISARNLDLDAQSDPEGLAGPFIAIEISDTGCGMAPEVSQRAFEPFFTTKEAGQGTGLGLAQVYGFARQSGGSARICSRPGAGTTVKLLLPRAAHLPQRAAAAAVEHAGADSTEEGRILLVEDDPDVAELTGEMLRHLGYDVMRVDSASAAMDVMTHGAAIDLVLTDVLMPGDQDGLDLAEQLLKDRPELPILLYSGYGGAPQRVAAAGLSLLRKPFTMRQLKQAVSQVRSGRAAPESRAQ